MGWGRWLLLGDLGQQLDIADQQAQIDALKGQLLSRKAPPSNLEQRLDELQRENDELKLYLTAVIRMLMAKNLASADEIRALVTAIDREDGVEDKKFKGPVLGA